MIRLAITPLSAGRWHGQSLSLCIFGPPPRARCKKVTQDAWPGSYNIFISSARRGGRQDVKRLITSFLWHWRSAARNRLERTHFAERARADWKASYPPTPLGADRRTHTKTTIESEVGGMGHFSLPSTKVAGWLLPESCWLHAPRFSRSKKSGPAFDFGPFIVLRKCVEVN